MRPIIGVTNTTRQGFIDAYVNAVAAAGGAPLVLPVLDDSSALDEVLGRLDGLVFSGGSDIVPAHYGEAPIYGLEETRPARDSHELAVLSRVYTHHRYPVLGICRGIQLLNVHAGGSCYQALEKQRPDAGMHMLINVYPLESPAHEVSITPDSRLHAILQRERLAVNSFHHQAIKELAPGFKVTAVADDGIIEAIEREGDRFVIGVQWHPEMMAKTDQDSRRLFEAFVRQCS
ncbi:MAG: gamma-glutamyl-gamma-aminobutyrate hydrolase family protein [Spirochaetaceae bacterium]|nr:MAG: gamma-glutamyl-gamma-aminobutyrate hydrolase family protein [Spirochaetaceae bacterium]